MGAKSIIIKVNGKLRDMLVNTSNITEEEVLSLAKGSNKVITTINNRKIRKVVYVPGQYMNIVTSLSDIDCIEEE